MQFGKVSQCKLTVCHPRSSTKLEFGLTKVPLTGDLMLTLWAKHLVLVKAASNVTTASVNFMVVVQVIGEDY